MTIEGQQTELNHISKQKANFLVVPKEYFEDMPIDWRAIAQFLSLLQKNSSLSRSLRRPYVRRTSGQNIHTRKAQNIYLAACVSFPGETGGCVVI